MFTLQIKLHPLLRHNADYYRKFLLFYEGETVMVGTPSCCQSLQGSTIV